MDRLTRKSQNTGMVWFIDHNNNDLNLEPCEMSYGNNRDAIQKLAYYEEAEEQGRLIVLPEDGMLYYIEENEEDKWICNRPIMDIIFKYGWGLVGLDCSLCDIGKKIFFSRKEAEAALRGECNECY